MRIILSGPETKKDITKIAVAKIRDKYYKTLEQAIEDCPDDGTQTTIEMLIDDTESVEIPANKNIVLDLCGTTLRAKNESSTGGEGSSTATNNPAITVKRKINYNRFRNK